MSRTTIGAALAVAALALAGTASADSADKSGGHDRTIRLAQADKTLQPTFVDAGKPGPSAGDLAVIHDGVLREDGAPAGSYNQVCTLAALGSSPLTSEFECIGSITLKDGTVTMAGPFVPARPEQSAAITGGTGAYRTAHGEVVIRAETDQLLVRLAR
jgi:hypothetical protein